MDRIEIRDRRGVRSTAPMGALGFAADRQGSLHFDNYVTAMTRLPFLRFLINSTIITTAATIGTVLSCSMAGFAFACLRWRGRRACFAVLLLTMVLPAQLLLVPRFLIFDQLGWINTYKPLIVPAWLAGSAFFTFLFREFFRGVGRDYADAARVDGASDWQVYWHVMLPMSRPVVAAVVSLAAVAHWQAFLDPLVYLSDFRDYPVSVGLRMFQAVEGSWANLIMAASIVSLGPPLLLMVLTQRFLLRRIGVPR